MTLYATSSAAAVLPGESREFVLTGPAGFAPAGPLVADLLDERFANLTPGLLCKEALADLRVELQSRWTWEIERRQGDVLFKAGGKMLVPLYYFRPSLGGGINWGLPGVWADGTFALRVFNDSSESVTLTWRISGMMSR